MSGTPLQTAYFETTPTYLGYTNNVFPSFPPLMADGRNLGSSWQPESTENNQIISNNGIKTNYEYRKYLTDNALQIMKKNYMTTKNEIGYQEINK